MVHECIICAALDIILKVEKVALTLHVLEVAPFSFMTIAYTGICAQWTEFYQPFMFSITAQWKKKCVGFHIMQIRSIRQPLSADHSWLESQGTVVKLQIMVRVDSCIYHMSSQEIMHEKWFLTLSNFFVMYYPSVYDL